MNWTCIVIDIVNSLHLFVVDVMCEIVLYSSHQNKYEYKYIYV